MPKHKRFGDETFENNDEEIEVDEDESTAPFKEDISLEFSDSDEAPETISLGVGKERAVKKFKEERDILKRNQQLEKEKRQKFSSQKDGKKKDEDDSFEQELDFIEFDQEENEEEEEEEEKPKPENLPSNMRVKTLSEVIGNTSKKNDSVEKALAFQQQRLYGTRVNRVNANDYRARRRTGKTIYNFSVKKRKIQPRK